MISSHSFPKFGVKPPSNQLYSRSCTSSLLEAFRQKSEQLAGLAFLKKGWGTLNVDWIDACVVVKSDKHAAVKSALQQQISPTHRAWQLEAQIAERRAGNSQYET